MEPGSKSRDKDTPKQWEREHSTVLPDPLSSRAMLLIHQLEYWPFSFPTYSESQKYTPTQAFSLNIRTLPFSPSLSAENPLSVTQTIQSAANAHPLLCKAGVDSNWDIFGPFGPFETPSTKKHHSDHLKYPVWSFKAQTQHFQGKFLTAEMLFPWDFSHYCQLLWRQFLPSNRDFYANGRRKQIKALQEPPDFGAMNKSKNNETKWKLSL